MIQRLGQEDRTGKWASVDTMPTTQQGVGVWVTGMCSRDHYAHRLDKEMLRAFEVLVPSFP